MTKKKTGVLYSGGMDSFLAWKLHAPNAALVFVDIGQKYIAKEYAAVNATSGNTRVVVVKTMQTGKEEMPSGIILHRNAMLVTAAAFYYNDIIMGVVADEINSDKSPEFMTAMETVLNISHRGQYWNNGEGVEYSVRSPIRDYTKSELVAEYLMQGHNEDTLLKTVSCYAADDGQCGQCPSCFKRWVALTNNGMRQPFQKDPLQWAVEQGIVKKTRDGTYAPRRANEILTAMRRAGR